MVYILVVDSCGLIELSDLACARQVCHLVKFSRLKSRERLGQR